MNPSAAPLVMIVDDSPSNIDILANTLKKQYRLIIAKNGLKAVEFTRKHLPDLILMDVVMPEMDGFQACRYLKSLEETRDIPIIFITAMGETAQKNTGFELGAVDYITRPFHASEVLSRVKTHLSLRRLHLVLAEKNQLIKQALKEKNRQLDVLIGNLPGMVYRCRFNRSWSTEFVSDGCRNLTGLTPAAFLEHPGRHYRLMAFKDEIQTVQQAVDAALGRQKPYEQLYRIKTRSGAEKWVMEQGVGVYGPAGGLIGMEGFISDVTAKQKASLALARENRQLKSKIVEQGRFGDIVGTSAAMQKVYGSILQAAAGEDCVIIYGASGTGKELVAKAIHKNSIRKDKPFVPVNCGAIPEGLFESEFFGHKKGAFSGANVDKKGILDMSDGGTLFLDELGEISLSMQVKLLRVMDGNGFIPVGGTRIKRPDIRFVCATNKDLNQMVRQGKIREDFFFRVHIIPITLPSLKERKEDIPLLIEHFLNSYPRHEGSASVTDEVIARMVEYSWPGNIRQLQNTLYQFLTLGKLEFLDITRMGRQLSGNRSRTGQSLKEAVETFEKQFITQVLNQCRGKKGKAAERLGMDRKTLFRKIKRYKITI